MKKKIFAAAMALCLMAGTSAFAQNQSKNQNAAERPTVEQLAQRRTDNMTAKLNLNEAQAKQVYQINLQQVKEKQAQAEQMRAAHKAKVEKMKSILTPEQFEQWKQMAQQANGRQHGQGHHGNQGKACAGKTCPKK